MEPTIKTIFQSQEMLVGGGKMTAEMKVPFGYFGKQRRSKSVSISGARPPRPTDSMILNLQLKKSSASTNVSILNLAEVENFDQQSSSSESEEESPKSQVFIDSTETGTSEPSIKVEKQDMTTLLAAIEEIRKSTAEICENFKTMTILVTSMEKTIVNMNKQIESLVSEGNCASL
ncbi:testis-specific serine kinase substrate isoform 1-T1 [Anomaloglossus baeobatrachus]|uniref:testis-specific serine kinase substrate isoform X1 n=1 Tax=Anomaloglossus baeobatrachus TaxID=238106 RepID=UPI003F505E64